MFKLVLVAFIIASPPVYLACTAGSKISPIKQRLNSRYFWQQRCFLCNGKGRAAGAVKG